MEVSLFVVRAGLLAGLALVVGCQTASPPDELVPTPMPGEPIVQDGSRSGGMLLYDGHFVGGLKGEEDVHKAVDRLTPAGTFSVLINDDKKRIFNVDSVKRLEFYIEEVEHAQGPFPDDVTFTIRSIRGVEGTVTGKGALRSFFAERFDKKD